MCACRTKTVLGIALADNAAFNLGLHDTISDVRQGLRLLSLDKAS